MSRFTNDLLSTLNEKAEQMRRWVRKGNAQLRQDRPLSDEYTTANVFDKCRILCRWVKNLVKLVNMAEKENQRLYKDNILLLKALSRDTGVIEQIQRTHEDEYPSPEVLPRDYREAIRRYLYSDGDYDYTIDDIREDSYNSEREFNEAVEPVLRNNPEQTNVLEGLRRLHNLFRQ